MSGLGLHSAHPRSPGAARSGTRAFWVTPPELSEEMLLSAHVPFENCGAPAKPVCWYERNVVVAATPITFGSLDGEPMVLVVPESPVLATTVTPASTAASSASEIGSLPVSGNGLPPNDSLMTSTPATFTA